MRYGLRTLLIVLAVVPPMLAATWIKYSQWQNERERRKANAAAVQLKIQAVLRQGRVLTPMFLDGVDEINNPPEPDDSN